MRGHLLAVLLACLALPAVAQDPVPDRRPVVTRDTDFYGGDLQPLFDTDLEACQRLCLNDAACGAFTFNTRNSACFPKTGVTDRVPYSGAISGILVPRDPELAPRAAGRAADLAFLERDDLSRARDEALALGARHGGGEWEPDALLQAARDAEAQGQLRAALNWTGAALAQSDTAELWLDYGRLGIRIAEADERSRDLRDRAVPAAVNAYLRAGPPELRVDALLALARALESQDRGREMIPALRLAEDIAPREEVTRLLDDAIGKYGFRITGTRVESDSATPRICAEFSEPLVKAGQDYAPFVALPDDRLVVQPGERDICVDGVEHGARYEVTFREGLPAASGESLAKDVPIALYVRDRAPSVAFPGRAYVLPPSPGAGLPVETVNTDALDLTLRRVGDRNLLRAMQEDFVGRPLGRWDLNRLSGDVAETVWTGTAEVETELNADMTARLPMGEALDGRAPGLYALSARVAGAEDDGDAVATQWFVLSDIGLTSFAGSDGLTIVARGLSDAAPLEGLSVSLLSRSNRELGRAETDAEGVARFPGGLLNGTDGAEPALLVAERADEDMTFLSLTDPAFDLSDRGAAGRESPGPLDAFLAPDRGAYRAGETVHATVLLRDGRAQAVEGVPVTAILTRPDGVEHARAVSSEARAGGHVFDFDLGASVPRGTWRLAVHADPDAPPLASEPILVEDFVPERIDFDLALPEGPIRPGAPPRLGVSARYLFGAPGADLAIEGEVRLTAAETFDALPGWHFGRHDDVPPPVVEALEPGSATDADGTAELSLPLPEPDVPGLPYTAEISLRLSEGSGRPVERRISRPVAPASPMIGIDPLFDGPLPEGSRAAFRLQGFGADLEPAAMEVDWTLNLVETRYQWYELYGNWNWEPVTTRSRVASGHAALGDPVEIAEPVEWGRYELVVERTDGPYVASSVGFEAGWYAPADAAQTPDMLELSLDAESYRPGDTATLRMVPRAPGEALVTVLTDRVVSMQTVAVPEGETTLALPVTEDWSTGAYVTAEVIRPLATADGRTPTRALGLAHAAVAPGDKALSVAIDAPDETAPRGPLDAVVTVDGLADGDTGWVTLAAVDVGVLNLTGYEAPDPERYYFGQRRLGVEIRDLYGRLIDGTAGTLGRVRSGGDAAGKMSLDSPPPTEAVVARFSRPLDVGPDGTATARFDLPDFNGTVKLMAVAWSARGVGSASKDVLVRDPVVLSAALPRFLAPGDTTRLRLELTHASGPAGEVGIEITADGVTLDTSDLPDSVALADGGRAVLGVPLRADAAGDHGIEIALTTPDGTRLTQSLTLGVRRNDPEISETRRLTLAPGEVFTLDDALLTGFAPDGAEALVSAGPLARFDAAGLLAHLQTYPYGCTEQIASQTMPLLALSSVAEELRPSGAQGIRASIADGIARMLTRQAPNGAFGLWRAEGGEPWLDAYVTDILSRARTEGYDVPDTAFANALDNLANRVAYAPDFDEGGGSDIAYALLVLAREGRAAIGDLRYYADTKSGDFATPLALAQLGAALAQYGEQSRADRLFRAAADKLAAETAERDFRADFGSPYRDAGAILTLASESGSEAPDRPRLAARLSAPDGPLSTQEEAWALMAAHALVTDPAAPGLTVDGALAEGPYIRRRGPGAAPQRIENTGTAPLPLTITVRGVPDVPRDAGGYGYAIDRAYFTRDGQPVDIHSGGIAQGTRLVAVLTIRPAEATGARLMVDDPLPAGFEIDNPSLLRAGDLSGLDWLQTAEPDHAEFRSDRFLAAMTWQGTAPFRLAYGLRAVSPGSFRHPAASVEDMYRPEYGARTGTARVTVVE